jgi:hypothetical protein
MNENFGSMFVSEQPQDGQFESSAVSMARIDDILPHNLPIHFVKMDVEGAEIHALRGMAGILERYHPTIVIELNELALKREHGSAAEELIELLKGFSYNIREIGSNREFALPAYHDGYLLTSLVCTPHAY